MYSKQAPYEEQLKKLGLMNEDAFTCACYLDQVGNTPKKGEILTLRMNGRGKNYTEYSFSGFVFKK
jgi:hypothetical protein